MVVQLEWSMDGNRLLALSEDSTIKVHRMKVSSIVLMKLSYSALLSLSLSLSHPYTLRPIVSTTGCVLTRRNPLRRMK